MIILFLGLRSCSYSNSRDDQYGFRCNCYNKWEGQTCRGEFLKRELIFVAITSFGLECSLRCVNGKADPTCSFCECLPGFGGSSCEGDLIIIGSLRLILIFCSVCEHTCVNGNPNADCSACENCNGFTGCDCSSKIKIHSS